MLGAARCVFVAAQAEAGPVSLGTLAAFGTSRLQVTSLPGWPVGRTPKGVVAQGSCAHGYVRRSWKPADNDGTWMDFQAGWQGSGGLSDTIRVVLDDDSEIELAYTVQGTIPTPQGTGVVRYLDATAPGGGDGTQGSPWNDWATAIAGLAADDVLVVSARPGGGVYTTISATGGPSSSVNGCKVVADPDDIAAGRRPRVHVRGDLYSQFASVPNNLWEVDPGSTAGFEVYRTKTDSEFSDPVVLAGLYKTAVGGYGALCQYFNDGLNHIRDDQPTARFDPQVDGPNGRNNRRYLFPGLYWNSLDGRLYCRLDPRPDATTTDPASGQPNPPWDWSDAHAESTDPNQCELLISSTETDSGGETPGPGRNYAINIDGTTGWEFQNLDFVGGGNAIRARTTTAEAKGCRFFGQVAAEIADDLSGTVADGKDAFVLDINGGTFTLDRCEVWGGFKGWHTNNACVKIHEGHFGLPVRRILALMRDGASLTLRNTLVDGILYLVRQSGGTGPRFADLKMHHVQCRNVGANGAIVTAVHTGEIHFLRSEWWDGALFGWTGGEIADAGDAYIGTSMISNIRPTKHFNGWYANDVAQVNQFHAVATNTAHGTGTQPDSFGRYNCTMVGAHRHAADTAGQSFGSGSSLGPISTGDMRGAEAFYRAYNNLAAVYPHQGEGVAANFTAYNADSHIALLAEPAGVGLSAGQLDWDYNHYWKPTGFVVPADENGSGFDEFVTVKNSSGVIVEAADLAGIQANSSFETNGSEGDPLFTVTPDTTVDDPTWRTLSRWTLGAGSPAATGGNTALSGEGWPDIDVDGSEFTYAGHAWRGALEPDVPAIEQQVGPLGPMPSAND